MGNWGQAVKDWLNLFLKSNCPLCSRPADRELCSACMSSLRRCQFARLEQLRQGQPPQLIWGYYGGSLKRAIAALKYENQPQLARPLGHWLGQAWLESDWAKMRSLVVVPIPLHADKLKQRGFNQAQLLAQSFCQVTRFPLEAQGLERIRSTEAQFSLSVEQRQQNLAAAFEVGKRLSTLPKSSQVLLLDDIYTTGATVHSAAKTLQSRGISVFGVAAVATSSKI